MTTGPQELRECPFCDLTPKPHGDSGLCVIHPLSNTCPLDGLIFFIADWQSRASPPVPTEAPAAPREYKASPWVDTRLKKEGKEGCETCDGFGGFRIRDINYPCLECFPERAPAAPPRESGAALWNLLAEDAAGRPVTELMREAAQALEDNGPLADCLRIKADEIDDFAAGGLPEAPAPESPKTEGALGEVVERLRDLRDHLVTIPPKERSPATYRALSQIRLAISDLVHRAAAAPTAPGERVLTWTKTTPVKEGWYWLRHARYQNTTAVVEVADEGGTWKVFDTEGEAQSLQKFEEENYQWAGPIPEPGPAPQGAPAPAREVGRNLDINQFPGSIIHDFNPEGEQGDRA